MYLAIWDYEPDGYGVRARGRYGGSFGEYWDHTGGAGTEEIKWDYIGLDYFAACNRDALSDGTIRVFGCDGWVWTEQ